MESGGVVVRRAGEGGDDDGVDCHVSYGGGLQKG